MWAIIHIEGSDDSFFEILGWIDLGECEKDWTTPSLMVNGANKPMDISTLEMN